jgi:hypothetical protein
VSNRKTAKAKPKRGAGNKPYWTDARKAVAIDIVLEQIGTTEKGLKAICDEFPEVPSPATFHNWLADDPSLQERYARAREEQGDLHADELVRIADEEPDPNKARVRIDARKWAASKRNPKKYGDKLTLDGEVTTKLSDDQLDARLAHLLRKAGADGSPGGEGAEEAET